MRYHFFRDDEELRLKLANRHDAKTEKVPLHHKSHSAGRTGCTPGHAERKQLCSLIAKYRSTGESHDRYIAYMQKEGKAEDGSSPDLYGTSAEYKEHEVPKHWRLILSPDSQDVDLDTLTTEFVKKLEKSTGYKFYWLAANHYDTDNKHVHLLINGIDQNGRDVNFLPRELVTRQMREYCRDICTMLVGERTYSDIDRRRFTNAEKLRFNPLLDNAIASKMTGSDTLLLSSVSDSCDAVLLRHRIDFLSENGLCKFDKKNGFYVFTNDWQNLLKLYQKHSNYLSAYKYSGVSADLYGFHDLEKDGPCSGRVMKKISNLDNNHEFAVLLKQSNGSVRYVPLPYYPKDCRIGEKVEIKTRNRFIEIKKTRTI